MQISQEEVVNRQSILHIQLEDDDVDPYVDRGYQRAVQRTNIPGFRKGKAPRSVVENYLGRDALVDSVLGTMLPEITEKVISDKNLEVVGAPSIEVLNLNPVTFKAVVPLIPDIKFGSYENIRIAQEFDEITDEDVQTQLEQLRYNTSTWEPVDRPLQMGDMVTVEVIGKIGDKTVIDEKNATFVLDVNDSRPLPGFSQHLEGLTQTESKDFDMDIPEGYQGTDVTDGKAHFSVIVSETKERILPDLDNEFAKSIDGDYKNLEDLRSKLESDLKKEAENRSIQRHRESVIDALLDTASIELPPLIIEHEIKHMEDERTKALSRFNVRLDDYLRSIGKTELEMKDELRDEAVNRLNRTFALSKLTELENIEASDEEVDEKIQSVLAESKQPITKQTSTDEMKSSVRRMLLAEKVIDRLVSIAKREPVSKSKSKKKVGKLKSENSGRKSQKPKTKKGSSDDK